MVHILSNATDTTIFQSIDTYQAYVRKTPSLSYQSNTGSIPFRSQLSPTLMSQEILKALEIAQSEGYISKDGHFTAAGKNYVEQNKEVFSLME